ncbi:MAG: hypothetical protein C4291_14820 [Candidatus Dadabacteria bacterium]
MISVAVWASRVQAALGREPESVQEALEGLRKVLREDEVSKKEFFRAAREGWRFERFSRNDRVALVVWAALKTALEKTRRYLDQKNPSSLVVRTDDKVREERRVKPIGTWKGPDGRSYEVWPWDLRPRRDDRWCGQPDYRVAQAREWLLGFLASGEQVRGTSRLERELEGGPHFSEGFVSAETADRLERCGFHVDPYNLEDLGSLVELLPAREEKFKEEIKKLGALVPRKHYEGLIAVLAREDWTIHEVLEHLKPLARALPTPAARRLSDLLQEVGALRLLKVELHRAGVAPVRAVAYRDPNTGEVLFVAPVYGQ